MCRPILFFGIIRWMASSRSRSGSAIEQLPGLLFLLPARIAAVTLIRFLPPLLAGEHHLVDVGDDHEVARVDVRACTWAGACPSGSGRSGRRAGRRPCLRRRSRTSAWPARRLWLDNSSLEDFAWQSKSESVPDLAPKGRPRKARGVSPGNDRPSSKPFLSRPAAATPGFARGCGGGHGGGRWDLGGPALVRGLTPRALRGRPLRGYR